ncbi:hypothetical protein TG4357_00138 [Thalassovita gelatinovora]|uniref:Uncharacterized protein n=1 Tax=Thalassovita gelatinovora TaxID=53501 RepID=A0A0P1FMW7_THAGE|nr:hypothetical protein [Thalassovita gelatinovora]CUH62491.1 hypothetical protein TG4357_00138 [Thalassovita gelatinovora]SEQ05374.1 hypothetical protein SAMN04488043_10338 [Thalassovita gelatinovora]
MFREIKSIIDRSQDTLLSDAIGAAALITMFVIGLHLPLIA